MSQRTNHIEALLHPSEKSQTIGSMIEQENAKRLDKFLRLRPTPALAAK